ncbi:MAG TPA: tetratricopeptide repeat protein [Nitrospiraceae bacterium]|jgi:TolA-binding protein|nr:tetratricopeptide repeat protein [Nitrospiraceae bacterium]
MKHVVLSIGVALGLATGIAACDSGGLPGNPKKEATTPLGDAPILAAASSPGQADNNAGVEHYKERRWDLAEQQFRKAVQADERLAEAHYNLGLALDKLGDHEGAAAAFKRVTELSPKNSSLRDSIILKEHVGL